MIFKCECEPRDSSTNWILFAIHAEEKRKYKAEELGFWAKLSLWLRGKL